MMQPRNIHDVDCSLIIKVENGISHSFGIVQVAVKVRLGLQSNVQQAFLFSISVERLHMIEPNDAIA